MRERRFITRSHNPNKVSLQMGFGMAGDRPKTLLFDLAILTEQLEISSIKPMFLKSSLHDRERTGATFRARYDQEA